MEMPRGRKRARLACKPCRDLKRKCDGQTPCATCVRFEYSCSYRVGGTKGKSSPAKENHGQSRPQNEQPFPSRDGDAAFPPAAESNPGKAGDEMGSREANSGARFLRRLALRLDPTSAPRLHTFAWNAFLGARYSGITPDPSSVVHLLSLATMRELSSVYFQKIYPCYGFVDRQHVENEMEKVWARGHYPIDPMDDAILCGIAALGYLFSHVEAPSAELDLVETARHMLEPTLSRTPTMTSITAWVLRVVYLRIASTYHEAWMASCVVMHMIESVGLHRENDPGDTTATTDIRRRIVAVARHLNIWMSFDMGRSTVPLCNLSTQLPSPRPDDYTSELTDLLPYSVELDPQRSPTTAALETALSAVLARTHSEPPSVLAQCNLGLCLCRRLLSSETSSSSSASTSSSNFLLSPSSPKTLTSLLSLCDAGVRAARAILEARSPWHHVANVPFQIVCLLLAIDHHASTPRLKAAVTVLADVAAVYDTDATREALGTASSLIALHVQWKERCTTELRETLDLLPLPPPIPSMNQGSGGNKVEGGKERMESGAGSGTVAMDTVKHQHLGALGNMQQQQQQHTTTATTHHHNPWLTDLSKDLSSLPFLDIDEFMMPAFLRNGYDGQ